jgi:uncharacterized damage-inducible protein DinB
MKIATGINDLFRHMEWADALIWTAVLSSPIAAEDASLRDRLTHVHHTQHGFLQVWCGLAADLPREGFPDSPSLLSWARPYYSEALMFAGGLDDESLARDVPGSLVQKATERLGVGQAIPSIADTALQVLTHSTYHRGQICSRLRELGCEPPLTEYFIWVWNGKPEAVWPVIPSPAKARA